MAPLTAKSSKCRSFMNLRRIQNVCHIPYTLAWPRVRGKVGIASRYVWRGACRASAAPTGEVDVKEAPYQSKAYPFPSIERKWQDVWEERGTFRSPHEIDKSKPKHYVLDMFPYPRYLFTLADSHHTWPMTRPPFELRSYASRGCLKCYLRHILACIV